MEIGTVDSIGAYPLSSHNHPPRRFPRGRVCAAEGCKTVLSIYNSGSHCYRHEHSGHLSLHLKKIA